MNNMQENLMKFTDIFMDIRLTFLPAISAILVVMTLLSISTSTLASRPNDVTDAEIALLPRYCPDTMGFKYGDATTNTSPNAAKWVAIMGRDFWNVHHYCWGLIKLRRAERRGLPEEHKRGHRESALADFLYVINKAQTDFVLAPEILTWIGRTEILLKRPDNANETFVRVRKLKPDYWPAYYHWAEYLQKTGRKAEAMVIVKAGLQYSPEAKTLRAIFFSLGGKQSDIPSPVINESILIPKPESQDNTENIQAPVTQ